MLTLQYLLAAAALIPGLVASPMKRELTEGTEFKGAGVYQILNKGTGTAIDLFNGGKEIYGWKREVPITSPHQKWRVQLLVPTSSNGITGIYAIYNVERNATMIQTGDDQNLLAAPYLGPYSCDDYESRTDPINFMVKNTNWYGPGQSPSQDDPPSDRPFFTEIIIYKNGRRVDLASGSAADQTPITSGNWKSSNNQRWIFKYLGP